MVKDGWYPTVCYQCKAECAIEARIQGGRVTEVRGNPRFRGKACVKGMAGVTLQYSKDRLTKPLKRIGERGEGKFAEISWDEALDTIEAKLRGLYDRGEAHKLTYSFFPHSLTDPKWHFLNAYGGYINTGLPHCDSAKIVAQIKCWGGIPNHHIPPAMVHHAQGRHHAPVRPPRLRLPGRRRGPARHHGGQGPGRQAHRGGPHLPAPTRPRPTGGFPYAPRATRPCSWA